MARERKFSMEELYSVTKETLLNHGYEGFNFGLLAERLDIARGTIYKYFENKEELISSFMLYEMDQFLLELKGIEDYKGFEAQFHFLFDLFFSHSKIYHIIEIGQRMPTNTNDTVRVNMEKLDKNRLKMYQHLQAFIDLGKRENRIKAHLPDSLILGYMFQSIAIPNHFNIDQTIWVNSIKEMIGHGIFN